MSVSSVLIMFTQEKCIVLAQIVPAIHVISNLQYKLVKLYACNPYSMCKSIMFGSTDLLFVQVLES